MSYFLIDLASDLLGMLMLIGLCRLMGYRVTLERVKPKSTPTEEHTVPTPGAVHVRRARGPLY